MGTSDYREYKKTRYLEVKAVRRAVLWYRVRVWLWIAAMVALPAGVLALMLWSVR